MKEIQLSLNGETFKIKYSFRALMYFEEMTSKKIDQINENVSDTLTIFYCILKASNRDKFNYIFDEFVDVIDEFPTSLEVFTEFLTESASTAIEPAPKVKKKKV